MKDILFELNSIEDRSIDWFPKIGEIFYSGNKSIEILLIKWKNMFSITYIHKTHFILDGYAIYEKMIETKAFHFQSYFFCKR